MITLGAFHPVRCRWGAAPLSHFDVHGRGPMTALRRHQPSAARKFLPIATRVHHKRARGSSRNRLGASRARRSCLASAPSDHWRRYTPARIRRL